MTASATQLPGRKTHYRSWLPTLGLVALLLLVNCGGGFLLGRWQASGMTQQRLLQLGQQLSRELPPQLKSAQPTQLLQHKLKLSPLPLHSASLYSPQGQRLAHWQQRANDHRNKPVIRVQLPLHHQDRYIGSLQLCAIHQPASTKNATVVALGLLLMLASLLLWAYHLYHNMAAPLNMLISKLENIAKQEEPEVHLPLNIPKCLQPLAQAANKVLEELGQKQANLKKKQDHYYHLAQHDRLTGLPNRHLFMQRLEEALDRAHDRDMQVAILFMDLDRFKNINDSLGHEAGDKLLTIMAQRLQQSLRQSDTVARFGGDEFVILLENLETPSPIKSLAQKILTHLREPIQLLGRELQISTSIGGAVYPADAREAETLIRLADTAMYQAKEQGRNTLAFYEPDMGLQAERFLALEEAIRTGLREKQFYLLYQPQFALADGTLSGIEALLHWQHPTKGTLQGDDFLPQLMDSSLIEDLGLWLLQTVCAQIAAWQEQEAAQVPVAMNLPPVPFKDPLLVETLDQLLQQYPVPASMLELEIDETLLHKNFHEAIVIFTDMRIRGLRLTIDHFGSGPCHLRHLSLLPLDKVKIAPSYIQQLPENGCSEAVVRSAISLGQAFDLEVAATGINSSHQSRFLQHLGCQQGQGRLYSNPLTAAAMGKLMGQQDPAAKVPPGSNHPRHGD